eukprot:8934736-Pyramimonas_sp.AAC.1
MYKAGSVYLHSELTSPTYNQLYFNQSSSVEVSLNQWHYAEITVDGNEIEFPIPSDMVDSAGNTVVPTYVASMIVDNVTYDGQQDG